MRSVTLYASRPSGIGTTAYWREHSVASDRVLLGDEVRPGEGRDWIRDLLDDSGLPIIGLVWEVAHVATIQRVEMYEGDSMSILVHAGDIPLAGADITYVIDVPGANIVKRVGSGIVVRPEDESFEIVLDPEDTNGFSGVFRQQVRIVDAVEQAAVVLDGHVLIRRRIPEE